MPKREDIRKVLVIGSGPIVIGQAAEFDYSGTQACKAMREEGISVTLVNSNPATIMTDLDVADSIYIEPLTVDTLKKIIHRERPQGILATLGGQTALNIATDLNHDGILDIYGVKFLGTSIDSITLAEDRESFKELMESIGQKVPHSKIATSLEEGMAFAKEVGFPIIVRPAYTLGGTGGGMASNMDEFISICTKGLKNSPISQVLIEESVAGWKEIELEVLRDNRGQTMVVCSMENFDPVGVHTGDSIVAIPPQTLTPYELDSLRHSAFDIANALDIKGGCNVQFALNSSTGEHAVIEVNPRVSRSSALASKATGYPIAKIASKIALGLNLDEIQDANVEPILEYTIVKVPRWPFDKFITANRKLGTQMKATGEVMGIGHSFEEALLKAIDSLDIDLNYHIGMEKIRLWDDGALLESLESPDDERIFAVSEALKRGYSVDMVHDITYIDRFFIEKLNHINKIALDIQTAPVLSPHILTAAKECGLGDNYIANLRGEDLETVTLQRKDLGIIPCYKNIGNSLASFYSTYSHGHNPPIHRNKRVIVLGSGPIRIGQGIEFDYCSVHSVKALKKEGIEAIIINNNPETVSTDFDTADTLYFEPLTFECVMDVIEREDPIGVIVQFGGQTAINLVASLQRAGVAILGTSEPDICRAEDRELFLQLLEQIDIPTPRGGCALSAKEAIEIAKSIGYPLMVRPSYVLGGRAMKIVYRQRELIHYLNEVGDIFQGQNLLLDRYIVGKEVEVDGICDGDHVIIPGIVEHIEQAGIHSGDSIGVYPPQTLSHELKSQIFNYSVTIAKSLNIKGVFNIQFIIDPEENIYVIEVNPRGSRTIPFLSKATGMPIVSIATRVMLGASLSSLGYRTSILPEPKFVAVKAPVFSFAKLDSVDPFLGPEMKSTGEVMGIGQSLDEALYKALISTNLPIPSRGNILLSIGDREKDIAVSFAEELIDMGYSIYATESTYSFLTPRLDIIELLPKGDAPQAVRSGRIDMVINTPTNGEDISTLGFMIRRAAMEFNIPCITCLDTATWALRAIAARVNTGSVLPLNEYKI